MYNTILPFLLLLLMPLGVSAQFYTISKASDSVQVLSSKHNSAIPTAVADAPWCIGTVLYD